MNWASTALAVEILLHCRNRIDSSTQVQTKQIYLRTFFNRCGALKAAIFSTVQECDARGDTMKN